MATSPNSPKLAQRVATAINASKRLSPEQKLELVDLLSLHAGIELAYFPDYDKKPGAGGPAQVRALA